MQFPTGAWRKNSPNAWKIFKTGYSRDQFSAKWSWELVTTTGEIYELKFENLGGVRSFEHSAHSSHFTLSWVHLQIQTRDLEALRPNIAFRFAS